MGVSQTQFAYGNAELFTDRNTVKKVKLIHHSLEDHAFGRKMYKNEKLHCCSHLNLWFAVHSLKGPECHAEEFWYHLIDQTKAVRLLPPQQISEGNFLGRKA